MRAEGVAQKRSVTRCALLEVSPMRQISQGVIKHETNENETASFNAEGHLDFFKERLPSTIWVSLIGADVSLETMPVLPYESLGLLLSLFSVVIHITFT